jgi:hypothetical protein
MDQAEITMVQNLHKNTGKTLEEWIHIVQQKNFAKHGEIINYLKSDFGFTHGFANLVAPKNAYVSLRRKKQFTILQPATKTRFEIGINLKGQAASGVLEAINTANAMCSHKINIENEAGITPEVLSWIRKAYDHAG